MGSEIVDDVQRAPGRPRSAQAQAAIEEAVVDVLATEGFGCLSMDKVAARAGVGKATIYRRWPSKLAMVIDVIARRAEEALPIPDTGTLAGDLRALAGSMCAAMRRPDALVLFGLLTEAAHNPELAAAVRDGFVSGRRAAVRSIFARGVDRGELRDDADVDAAIDMLIGALHHRVLFVGGPLDRRYADDLVDVILRGLAPRLAAGATVAARSRGRSARG